jgi:DNA polymerase-1
VEKFGVGPEQIVDFLALVGDAVDNVPGVEKVGPKTATKWLQQYGSLDGIVAHAAAIGGVVGEKLRAALPWLPTARTLVTVRTDVDLAAHMAALDDLRVRPPERERLRELFGRFEFRGWQRDFDASFGPDAGADAAAPAGAAPPNPRARIPRQSPPGPHCNPANRPANRRLPILPHRRWRWNAY